MAAATETPGMDAAPHGASVSRLRDAALKLLLFLYAAWYAGGLAIFTTGWFPVHVQVGVSGWGDCVFLSLAGLLTFFIAWRDCVWKDLALAGTFLILASTAVEIMGVKTGIPFGQYVYTEQLGHGLGGVPWIIPICWFILLLNAYIICSVLIVPREGALSHDSLILVILATSVVVTLVDLNLEPVAVNLKQYWHWVDRKGSFYGVPRINFFGWLSVSIVMVSALAHVLDPRRWKLSTAWVSLFVLGSIQLFFALMNWQAHQFVPVIISLNLIGILAIGLTWLSGK